MKVSVVALRKVLQKQLDEQAASLADRQKKLAAERVPLLQSGIKHAEKYIKKAKEMIAAAHSGKPADCLGELPAPRSFYSDRISRADGDGVRRALRLLDLSATDELTLADATRLVGKSVIECL